MSMTDKPGWGEYVENQFYLLEAARLRLRIVEHLQAVGLAEKGLGVVVHQINANKPNKLFAASSYTHVMVHNLDTPDSWPAGPTDIYIVTREHMAPNLDQTSGILINHFGLHASGHARLRHHGELMDDIAEKYVDDINGGPTFYTLGSDQLIYSRDSLTRIFHNAAQLDPNDEDLRYADDDFIFNSCRGDMRAALRYAHAVLNLVSDETVVYQQAA